jgi:hypothetical protein
MVLEGLDELKKSNNFIGNRTYDLTKYFQPRYGPAVVLASKGNEYQESSWGSKAPPACKADNLTTNS